MPTKHLLWRLSMLFLPAGLMAGCAAQTASFRPTLANTSSLGYRASLYSIIVDKHTLGTVKVYSEDGYKTPEDGSQSVIDVRLRIRNSSDAPIRLDLAHTDIDVDTDTGDLVIKDPVRAIGVEAIPPGAIARIALFYPLPGHLPPSNVNSFDFNWVLDTSKGLYSQSTPFIRRMVRNVYRYYPSYYPWDYPWGWYGWYPPYWYYGDLD
jgi:hypothetical protein